MKNHISNTKEEKVLPHWDLNHGPLEPKASVLPMSYADPKYIILSWLSGRASDIIPIVSLKWILGFFWGI